MKKIMVFLPSIAKTVGGGVATQVEMTLQEVEKLGIPIVRYSPWESYNWDEIAAVHLFRADYETHNFAKLISSKKIPLLVSPVFFSTKSASQIRFLLNITKSLRKVASGIRSDFDYVKEICELADALFPNTEEEKKLICESFQIEPSKCTVIHNGVSDRFSSTTPDLFQKQFGVSDIVLSVANLGFPRKNMLQAIKAMKETELPYFIIGPSYDNQYGRNCLKEIEKSPNITYIGALDNSDPLLGSALAAAKVFLLPSLFETPGIASMEAALAGSEIVTTPFGGPKEYFLNQASYVKPSITQSIKEAVLSRWNDTPLKPGAMIREKYLWDSIGEETANQYRFFL